MGCASTAALMIAAPGSDFLPPTSPSRSTAAISLRASRRKCASWAWEGRTSDLRRRRRSPLQPEPQHQHGCGVVRARLSRAIELAADACFENDVAVEIVAGGKAETRRDVPQRHADVGVRQIADRAGQREIAAQGMVDPQRRRVLRRARRARDGRFVEAGGSYKFIWMSQVNEAIYLVLAQHVSSDVL